MQKYRLFVSIELPEPVKEDIADTYRAIHGVKWVDTHLLHLTLRFLGESTRERYEAVIRSLDEIDSDSFSLSLGGAGHFPPRKDPRVLWVGVRHSDALFRLQKAVELKCRQAGFTPEGRKFHPHITVARIQGRAPVERVIGYLQENALFTSDQIPITAIHLFSSVLTRNGPDHTLEASFDLRTPA